MALKSVSSIQIRLDHTTTPRKIALPFGVAEYLALIGVSGALAEASLAASAITCVVHEAQDVPFGA
ncbi:hypothetical protein O2N63_01615 [Aliiroseovarius sp. KMU-50]|uniref:Uncharacterized protein n=1 Tax=Aliiroseovarius salicola TaxID=3009082 RepID=A0ABT4VX18_9RHOB|nr:hypothetical protein [Aliiroseovarius sp. KMU-50]MDA5092782.1 hypothetical protein [Aliiroseovarius sp. KMU-50]